MIKIQIIVNENGKIFDQLQDKNCTFGEVASALLRLKQIEQILIDKEFEDDLNIKEDI